MQKSVAGVRWWTRRRPVFVATLVAASAAIVLAGWFTDLRDLFHGAAVTIAVVAFLPFLVIGIGLVLLAAFFVLCSLAEVTPAFTPLDEGGGGLVGLGARMIRPYYRFLDRLRRHPVVWGICSGAVFGCAILGAMLALKVLPAEMETVDTLAEAQERIEAHYATHGAYPRATGGELVLDGVTVRDAFGNPLDYRVSGRWKLASYRLSSRGYDGEAGTDDDLCVTGATKLAGLVDAIRAKATTRSQRLESTRALRCN